MLHELLLRWNDFMAGHVLFECYKDCQAHTCEGVRRKKKALVNLDPLGRAFWLLMKFLNNLI